MPKIGALCIWVSIMSVLRSVGLPEVSLKQLELSL